jgi:hypothetical protein
MTCGRCKEALYCCKECQIRHWREHKPECKLICLERLRKSAEQQETERRWQDTMREVVVSSLSDSPAARGPVRQLPPQIPVLPLQTDFSSHASMAILAPVADAIEAALAENAQLNRQEINHARIAALCTAVHRQHKAKNFGAVISQEQEINVAARAAFRSAWRLPESHLSHDDHVKSAKLPIKLWLILGKSYASAGVNQAAETCVQLAYDVATWLCAVAFNEQRFNQLFASLGELLYYSVESLLVMTQLALNRAEEDVDPLAHTYNYAVPMLARLNELLPPLTDQNPTAAKLRSPSVFGISTLVCINLGCYDEAQRFHNKQSEAIDENQREHWQQANDSADAVALHEQQSTWFNFVGANLCYAQKKHQEALNFLCEILPSRENHATMDVEALILSAKIAIETVYVRSGQIRHHNKFIHANRYLGAAEEYLTANTASMHAAQINRLVLKLRNAWAELRLRQAQLLLRHGHKDAQLSSARALNAAIAKEVDTGMSEMRTVMEAIRIGDGFFSSMAPYIPKMHLLDACYAVWCAYMRKCLNAQQEDALVQLFCEEHLRTAETVLVANSENCAFATLHLAYLRTYQQQDGRQLLMTYLDQVFADATKKRCASCKNVDLPTNSLCSGCKLFRYCSQKCVQAAHNRFHVGGSWLEPPHSRICPLLAQYKKVHRLTGGNLGLLNSTARNLLEQLHVAMQDFLDKGPLYGPTRN